MQISQAASLDAIINKHHWEQQNDNVIACNKTGILALVLATVVSWCKMIAMAHESPLFSSSIAHKHNKITSNIAYDLMSRIMLVTRHQSIFSSKIKLSPKIEFHTVLFQVIVCSSPKSIDRVHINSLHYILSWHKERCLVPFNLLIFFWRILLNIRSYRLNHHKDKTVNAVNPLCSKGPHFKTELNTWIVLYSKKILVIKPIISLVVELCLAWLLEHQIMVLVSETSVRR